MVALNLVAFFEGLPTDGGTYVHKRGSLYVLRDLQQKLSWVNIVVVCDSDQAVDVARGQGLRGVLYRRTLFRKVLGNLSTNAFVHRVLGASMACRLSPVDRLLTQLGAHLVYFADQDSRALQLHSHSYIFSVLDACHLEHPEFPEVAHLGRFEQRERLFQRALRKAVAVITDSEYGRSLIGRYYSVPEDRIYAAPFLISNEILNWRENPQERDRIYGAYKLSPPYVFYPAQFWSHKNHRYILAALSIMQKKYGWCPQTVFCGADKGVLPSVLEYAGQLGVRDKVIYCGFVPSEDIPYLYKGALALVMPTYFGPTNIPPVEAASLGVNVLYSDKPYFREQMGDSAGYVDLADPETLADAIQLIKQKPAAGNVGARGGQIMHSQRHEYERTLHTILSKFRQKMLDPFAVKK